MSDYSEEIPADLTTAEQAVATGTDDDMTETNPVLEQVHELETQLLEKEGLVAALTARLEQAAEKLDRIHRTGGDRGLRTGGGFPPELVEEQKNLVDNLQRAVDQWDDMQTAAVLGRLEIQIADLRDLVADRVLDGRGSLAHTSAVRAEPVRGDRALSAENSEQTADDKSAATFASAGDVELSGYEAMKAGLLAAEGEEPQPPTNGMASLEPTGDLSAIAMDAVLSEISPEDPPKPIDVENADNDTILAAINERDAYISYLIRNLRVAESGLFIPPDWDALSENPEGLREAVEELQERLQGALRIAEVENSLERARLGREEVRLRQMEEQIQKARKRLGLADDEDDEERMTDRDASTGDRVSSDDEDDGAAGSRWMRMLGRRSRDA